MATNTVTPCEMNAPTREDLAVSFDNYSKNRNQNPNAWFSFLIKSGFFLTDEATKCLLLPRPFCDNSEGNNVLSELLECFKELKERLVDSTQGASTSSHAIELVQGAATTVNAPNPSDSVNIIFPYIPKDCYIRVCLLGNLGGTKCYLFWNDGQGKLLQQNLSLDTVDESITGVTHEYVQWGVGDISNLPTDPDCDYPTKGIVSFANK